MLTYQECRNKKWKIFLHMAAWIIDASAGNALPLVSFGKDEKLPLTLKIIFSFSRWKFNIWRFSKLSLRVQTLMCSQTFAKCIQRLTNGRESDVGERNISSALISFLDWEKVSVKYSWKGFLNSWIKRERFVYNASLTSLLHTYFIFISFYVFRC